MEQRRKLRIYTSENLIRTLVDAKIIIDPVGLQIDQNKKYMDVTVLLITEKGKYWAKKILFDSVGIANEFELYNVDSGKKISNEYIYGYISSLASTFEGLKYALNDSKVDKVNIANEFENIIQVSSGDNWVDYRPSRPKDFVGRETILKNEFDFYWSVLQGESETRLTAIKAPSGWGKSSLLLKIKEKSLNKRNRSKVFVCSVDLRAASSKRYAEMAIITCFNEAIQSNFIRKPKSDITINSSDNPFSSEGVQEIFEQLEMQNKLIVLYFDQFEEIFSKVELLELFESIRKISNAVDSIKENFILGYAWKTDGTIPTEHPAYSMWHNMKDRRFERNLDIFSKKEISKALNVFSTELGQTLNPNVRKYLEDQCQGYPWLLKKLSIHVYETITKGNTQDSVINQGLDIGKLFEQDMTGLTSKEYDCVKRIASESPADFFKMDQDFGDMTITSLLDKRIVIRKAHRLILYWDIFRDYVLTGILPKIDITYVPQGHINSYIELLDILLENSTGKIDDLAAQIYLGRKATENLLRDMVMFGNITRQGEDIRFVDKDEKVAISKVYDFFSNHVFMKKLKQYSTDNKNVLISEFEKEFLDLYSDRNIQRKTVKLYYKKLLRWALGLGIIELKSETYIHLLEEHKNIRNVSQKIVIQNKLYPFFGTAPASRVLELFFEIEQGEVREEVLNKKKLRNAITTGVGLGLLYRDSGNICLSTSLSGEKLEKEIAKRVLRTETIQLIQGYFDENKILPSRDWVGKQVNELLNRNWISSSIKRNGSALLNWYIWSNDTLNSESVQLKLDI